MPGARHETLSVEIEAVFVNKDRVLSQEFAASELFRYLTFCYQVAFGRDFATLLGFFAPVDLVSSVGGESSPADIVVELHL